jgi:hypothetical protein
MLSKLNERARSKNSLQLSVIESNSRVIMTLLDLSNFPYGGWDGMYQSAPWGSRFFFNPLRGNMKAISKLHTFVLAHLKCTDLISTRSDVGFIKQMQCSEILIIIRKLSLPTLTK